MERIDDLSEAMKSNLNPRELEITTSTDVREHQQAFDEFYLWHPIVKEIWLKGRVPNLMRRLDELNLDGSQGFFDAVFTRHVYEGLRLRPGLRVLTVGCGFGPDEQEMLRRVAELELVACDISETMIRTARRNGSPATLVQSPAEELPFDDGSFHRVLSREVIEHVISPPAMLRELYRVLAPGGIAVVTTPNGSGLVQSAVRLTGLFANRAVQDTAIPIGRLKRWMRLAGFDIHKTVLDGACYFMMVAWPGWLRPLTPAAAHAVHCLSRLPIIRRIVCDQVKFHLHKPAVASTARIECVPSKAPDSYTEDERDAQLREAVERAKPPAQPPAQRWIRGSIAALALPAAYLLFVVLLLPISLVLLVCGQVRKASRTG